MYLYLVRHGQSEGNVIRTFHGQTDYSLTELGRAQAAQAGEKLRADGVTFTRCLASDLSRAWNTALGCLEGYDITPEPCPALREQFVGDIEGLTWEEMGERYPGLRERYISDWYNTTPPGGESPKEISVRVASCVDEVIARGENTLLVGHFGSLTMVLLHLGLLEAANASEEGWSFGQGVYTAIRIENGKAELLCFNR